MRSRDCQRSREGQKKRRCQVSFTDEPAPSQSASPKMPSGKEGSDSGEADLGELLELRPVVASFLQGSPETSDNKGKKTPLEPAVSDSAEWVMWKAKRCDTPNWWMELSTVPEEDDTRKLARQVRVSFGLPCWLQELDAEEAKHQAPAALPCLHQQKFMPLADWIFANQDIMEVPREKVVAYTRALQYWVEQNDPPTGDEPHLLVKSVLELREEVKWYLTFTNEEIFLGIAVPKVEVGRSSMTPSPTNIPKMPLVPEPQLKERAPKFVGWERVLCLSQLVVTAGEIPQPTWTSRLRGRSCQLSWMISVESLIHLPEVPSPPEPALPAKASALVRPPTPP